MRRFFRDAVRRLLGTSGEVERAKQATYERDAARADKIIAIRQAQMETASARLVAALNSMRHPDDGS